MLPPSCLAYRITILESRIIIWDIAPNQELKIAKFIALRDVFSEKGTVFSVMEVPSCIIYGSFTPSRIRIAFL